MDGGLGSLLLVEVGVETFFSGHILRTITCKESPREGNGWGRKKVCDFSNKLGYVAIRSYLLVNNGQSPVATKMATK